MKKIIFFAVNMDIGGMEKALLILLNNLVGVYEITLVLEKKEGLLLHELDKRIVVYEYKTSSIRIVTLRKIINFSHRVLWAKRYANKYDFACSYATYSVIGSRLALLASQNAALYVHSDYYNFYKGDRGGVKTFFSTLNYDRFKHVLFVSNESRKKIECILPDIQGKSGVINNLIDFEEILKRSKESVIIPEEERLGKTVFLFVGRLEEESKKISRLLEAFSILRQKRDDCILWIVGQGKDYRLCTELIQKYNIEDCVELLGIKENPYPYISVADCVIMTSDFEGYPVIYNECLVLRKPIITTIPVSDQYIDIRDYATVVEKESVIIANAMEKFEKKAKKIPLLDFEMINRKRIDDIKEIIDGK